MRNGRNDDRYSSHHWLHFDHNGGIDKCGCGFLAEPDDNGWGDSIVEHFATVLRESLSARVTQAETVTAADAMRDIEAEAREIYVAGLWEKVPERMKGNYRTVAAARLLGRPGNKNEGEGND